MHVVLNDDVMKREAEVREHYNCTNHHEYPHINVNKLLNLTTTLLI